MFYMLRKNYKYMVTKFVFNAILNHVGFSWIIETNQQLNYVIYEHNQDWLTNGHWYNTSIFYKITQNIV